MDELIYTRLKDGLYVGNKRVAINFEFLIANKFTHVLNCTAELKNYFQDVKELHYFKLKYDRTKPHQRLWGDSMKKLFKIVEFISAAEEKGESCLIHSNIGDNRCFAVAIAYFMNKYSWTLNKTLEFVNSKNGNCKLSVNFLIQLQGLQKQLQSYRILTKRWDEISFDNDDELILVNTYQNTLQKQYKIEKKQQVTKRKIQWKDILEKQNAKSKKQLSSHKKNISKKHHESLSMLRNHSLKKNQLKKETIIKTNKSLLEVKQMPLHNDSIKSIIKQKQINQSLRPQKYNFLESKDSETHKYEDEQQKEEYQSNDGSDKNESKVIKVVINNFVNPNINITTHGRRRGSSPIERTMFSSKKPKQSLHQSISKSKSKYIQEQQVQISQRLIKSLMNLHQQKQQINKSQRIPADQPLSIHERSIKRNRVNNIKARNNINISGILQLNPKRK